MVGFQFFAMGAIGQAIPAALSYNLASHDLKLTLQHVSIRTVVVLCGIGAAEHHRRRVGRVRIARRLAGEPRAYFEEFFSDETGEVAKRRRRALEYFTQEEL
jgi:hypothetical protein